MFWRRKKAVVTAAEVELLKTLPQGTNQWSRDEWAKWRNLLDLDLVTVADVQGDFSVSYLMVLTPAGETARG
jgi:hypothetical protein